MNIALWVLQGILAATFLWYGTLKSTQSKERMIATGQTGVAPFPLPIIRIVAASEFLAGLGVVLPWLTGIAPVLTPIAAAWLGIVMIGAAVSHWSLKEYKQVFAVNMVVLTMCLTVAIGRFADL